MVPYTILTDKAQRVPNWWRKMPYISVLWKYLPEHCVIKNMHKRLEMTLLLPISFEAILKQQLPIAQLLAAPTVSLLDHALYVPCFAILRCVW